MILCCGEALIDMIPEATLGGKQGYVSHSGGSVFNTSIALGRLGVPVGMLTGLSSDQFGRQLRRELKESHVDVSHIVTSDRPTTLAFVCLSDGQASYDFYDENTAGRMLTASDLPTLADDVSILYFGGISLACEPGADAYASLLKREADSRIVMIDPNIRPGFVENEEKYRMRLAQMLAASDIVKISDEDLDWLLDGSQSESAKAQSLLKHGPSIVILTKGGAGSTAFLKNGQEVHASAVQAAIVDTVGAGDTFNAGVLARLSELGVLNKNGLAAISKDAIQSALEFGAEIAAVTVSRAGANPPWAAEL